MAAAQEVISARLAVLAARADVSRGEAGVTVATVAVLKALGAGIRPDERAARTAAAESR